MASNIYHMAEQEISDPHDVCVSGFSFGNHFQQMLALQAQMALESHPNLTAWISICNDNGNGGIIPLIKTQPQQISFQAMLVLSRLLARNGVGLEQISEKKISDLRASGVDMVHTLPTDLGALARVQLAPEIAQLNTHLWLVRPSESNWNENELDRADRLASILSASIDREVDLGMRDHAQRTEQRMTDLAVQIADLFAAPGLPISKRFRAMLDTCCTAFGMEKGYVTLLKDGQPEIQFTNSHAKFQDPENAVMSNCPSFSEQLLLDSKPLALGDVAASPFAHQVDLTGEPAGRYLGCPIRFDGRTHGTIEFAGCAAADTSFAQSECAMLQTLSIYAAGPLVLLGEALSY